LRDASEAEGEKQSNCLLKVSPHLVSRKRRRCDPGKGRARIGELAEETSLTAIKGKGGNSSWSLQEGVHRSPSSFREGGSLFSFEKKGKREKNATEPFFCFIGGGGGGKRQWDGSSFAERKNPLLRGDPSCGHHRRGDAVSLWSRATGRERERKKWGTPRSERAAGKKGGFSILCLLGGGRKNYPRGRTRGEAREGKKGTNWKKDLFRGPVCVGEEKKEGGKGEIRISEFPTPLSGRGREGLAKVRQPEGKGKGSEPKKKMRSDSEKRGRKGKEKNGGAPIRIFHIHFTEKRGWLKIRRNSERSGGKT